MRRATRWRGGVLQPPWGNQGSELRAAALPGQRPQLVTAAIVLWNTVCTGTRPRGLVEAGKPVDGELLQFLSPLGWEHINLTGDYVWRQSRRLEDGKFRPLRMPGKP
ncbi:Tn3 family transposase [Enterobacter kobei]|uniref:Tn3 family transposase n=1 Tax=Enterobacter kobei TaxID=208224 RepID=UPI00388DDF74